MSRARPSPPLALLNARLVDPSCDLEVRGGLLMAHGVIKDVGAHLTQDQVSADIPHIDCAGKVVAPGLVDMRVFMGEPGAHHRETIPSASHAALAGGITTIVATPETDPVVDDPAIVDFLLRRARDMADVRVQVTAALTKGLAGREMAELAMLKEAGAIAFSEGARPIRNSQLMLRLLTYARDQDGLVIHVAQDEDLAQHGVMHAGPFASRLGLPGMIPEAEVIGLERDVRLVARTRTRFHSPLLSTALSLDPIRRAKEQGLPVTCGVSINHLTLNEYDVGDYRTFFKLSPPLRSEEDRQALILALAEGLIDVIVSDHNPRDVEGKRRPFEEAEVGAVGLETLLPAGLRLVHSGALSLLRLLKALSFRPAHILGLPCGRLTKGAPADILLLDIDAPWRLSTPLRSLCQNTPFEGASFSGCVKATFVGGYCVFQSGEEEI